MAGQIKYKREDGKRAVEMYLDGLTIQQISKATGLTRHQVVHAYQAQGHPDRGSHRGGRAADRNPIAGVTKEVQSSADFLEGVLSQGGVRGLTAATREQIYELRSELERLVKQARKVANTLKKKVGVDYEVHEDSTE